MKQMICQNCPNSFSQSITMPFDLLQETTLKYPSQFGRSKHALKMVTMRAVISLDAANFSSGVYFVIATLNSIDDGEKKVCKN